MSTTSDPPQPPEREEPATPEHEGPVVTEPRPDAGSIRPPSSARDRGTRIGLGVVGVLVVGGIGLLIASPRRHDAPAAPALALTSAEGPTALADAGADSGKETAAVADAGTPRPPPVWRVASLKDDPNVEVSEGTFGKRGLVATLTQAGLARPEIRRIAQAFDGVHHLERPRESDAFVLAKDKSKSTLVAFELATSPFDVWQARFEEGQGAEGRLVVRKLDLFVERRRLAHALVVTADLPKAIAAAGMRSEIALAVDDALEGHVEGAALRPGARLRIAASEEWVEGTFARVKVDAIELVPKSGAPLRIYHYERDPREGLGSSRRAPAAGFYDAKGRQPYHGQFRSPLALARVTSRFNPKRLHPVLKTVMPHQGVDFGGATGTPVYASGSGTVVSAGNSGPCGNMVEIDHGGGLHTAYCHLKGFAQGLHAGEKVEQRQLVGYVGQTGRVTGPHLHFAVKKNGVFIDPLSIKMDGVRVLPPADRESFARRRTELDVLLDGVPLPSAADVPAGSEAADENEDKDVHEE